MTYQIGVALLPFCIIFIAIAYYFDYRSDSKEFKHSVNVVGKRLVKYFTIVLVGLILFLVGQIIFENI